MPSFPIRLRQAMHEKRFRAADVARATGITPSALSRYLSGENNPSPRNIVVIAQYLDVSSDWLLGASEASKAVGVQGKTDNNTEAIIGLQKELIGALKTQLMDKDR